MNEILRESIECCKACEEGKIYFNRTMFPFTTENISGYIKNFDLKDKSLLTVGSSGDQIINAVLQGSKDITLYDIVPESKYYYYLKVAGMISLTKEEFLEFFRFKSYIGCSENANVFNMKSFNKIKPVLKLLDVDSYTYFDELFSIFSNITLRKTLFSPCEYSTKRIEKFNLYLKSNILYDEAISKVKIVRPKFIFKDIFEIDNNFKYDNIWLSNIATWLNEKHKILELFNKTYSCLNKEGKLLFSYLYSTTMQSKYEENYVPIYDLNTIFDILKKYNIELKEFDGVKSDSDRIDEQKDSILLVKKTR